MLRKRSVDNNEKIFQNVNGKDIILRIRNHVPKACVEFIIEEDVNKGNTESKLITLFSLIFLSLLLFSYNIIKYNILSCLLIITVYSVKQLLTKVKSESVLLVKSFGIQYTVSYYFGSCTTKFIPNNVTENVFINEVITMHRVLYFLTVMINGEENVQIIPLFKYTKPRLKCLEIIYRCMDEVCNQ